VSWTVSAPRPERHPPQAGNLAKLQPAEPWGTSQGAPAKYERGRAGIHTGGGYPPPVAGAHPVRRQLSASPPPAPLRVFRVTIKPTSVHSTAPEAQMSLR